MNEAGWEGEGGNKRGGRETVVVVGSWELVVAFSLLADGFIQSEAPGQAEHNQSIPSKLQQLQKYPRCRRGKQPDGEQRGASGIREIRILEY